MFVALMVLQALVSFATVTQGTDSSIDESRQVVIRSAAEWQALWKAHDADRAAPVVDFARSVVEYLERRPPPEALTAQVLTSPYHPREPSPRRRHRRVQTAPAVDVRFDLTSTTRARTRSGFIRRPANYFPLFFLSISHEINETRILFATPYILFRNAEQFGYSSGRNCPR